MRRRPPSASHTLSLAHLTACLLLLPLSDSVLASLQQKPGRSSSSSSHGESQTPESPEMHSLPDSRESSAAEKLIDDHYRRYKDTNVDAHRASALATRALTASSADAAVRAAPSDKAKRVPTSGNSRSSGLSSLLHARSLQDWEVEDYILLATVDGAIHARDRRTGAPLWALEAEQPMVATTYHRANRTQIPNADQPEHDFLWIVEPSKDGDIYLYDQARTHAGLQRLHLTVRRLEELSPYASEDPAVVYTTEKKTTLYNVDARTGTITREFSSRATPPQEEPRCLRPNDLQNPEADQCGAEGHLILGRTEYTVSIQHGQSQDRLCTLTFSEWGPNVRDADLHDQYTTTMDRRYVYSGHDGRVFSFDHTKDPGRQQVFNQKLSSPVVRVFDVARSRLTDDKNSQLVLLPQPVGPLDSEHIFRSVEDRARVFVNQTRAGGWYAMSESTYPLVTGAAPVASCYSSDQLGGFTSVSPPSPAALQKALVGVHSLAYSGGPDDRGYLLAAPSQTPRLLLEAGPTTPSSGFLLRSQIIASAAANATDIVVSVGILLLVAFLTVNRRYLIRLLRRFLELKHDTPEVTIKSAPTSPLAADFPLPESPSTPKIDSEETIAKARDDESLTPIASRRNTLLEPPTLLRSPTPGEGEDRGRPSAGPRVRIVEPSPSPGPGDDEGGDGTPSGKKKARRGCRGGSKHKRKKGSSKSDEADAVEQIIEEAKQIGKEPTTPEPDVLEISPGAVTDVSSPIIQIGHLKVFTDTVLGFGSHGTVVYKGAFGGRDVAVKRMLLEFFDIASHEVGLLQESDDHPNVIRYYDKESAGDFLYIALELCPASLQDVIERSGNYNGLLGAHGLDPPDILKQITQGVRYLHSLKIVHRDIKPQNILVAAPKRLPTSPGIIPPPRLLISDFGLCKKLEGDQSSFRATTAHAAGTSGWRAPELLVDDDANAAVTSSSPGSPSTLSPSEPVVFDPQSNRRATRAIDIFSLGCVFYYVLTGGNHPFDRDGKYMREANIVKGNYSLADLVTLGDYQWEAKDLIGRMLERDPRLRPDAATVLAHPFFWSPAGRLEFLCHVSDQFEFECRDPPSAALLALEAHGPALLAPCGGDFLRPLPNAFKDTLGKQRKYVGSRVLDLLRALRNKKNHYEDMPPAVQDKVGALPDGYLGFWTRKVPGLLMACHAVVLEVGWDSRDRFRGYYSVPGP